MPTTYLSSENRRQYYYRHRTHQLPQKNSDNEIRSFQFSSSSGPLPGNPDFSLKEDWIIVGSRGYGDPRIVEQDSKTVESHPHLRSLYSPGTETPSLHVIGRFDARILPAQTFELTSSCIGSIRFHIFGSHYIPHTKTLTGTVKAFVRAHLFGNGTESEEDWEELDDPPEIYRIVLVE
ncbi:hypothetical protein N7539_009330 [Penicillium diatomitis]|uniref:Serine hydrolase domain-containing protein n=1 Tax=Penicillium diatomitis TaxID=2819901 RepID=A0A9W9WM46_9EURO|nr:uncharacterized protein N7539_009330 [Penicillium diatomitis]KAJ5469712.1 hypothetical protein N7539_009330 [Penicillium diatomitis]